MVIPNLGGSQPVSNACQSHWVALVGLRCGQEGGWKKGKGVKWKGRQERERKERNSEKRKMRPQATTASGGLCSSGHTLMSPACFIHLCALRTSLYVGPSTEAQGLSAVDWMLLHLPKWCSNGEVAAVCVWTLQPIVMKIQGVMPQGGSQSTATLCLKKKQSRSISTQ